ncbi:hypothetical protein Bbelb_156060 [Branchiostoma belcheri]|nr:hypothetical protein Bbelb_156060 [Branchiostoma belcheri]
MADDTYVIVTGYVFGLGLVEQLKFDTPSRTCHLSYNKDTDGLRSSANIRPFVPEGAGGYMVHYVLPLGLPRGGPSALGIPSAPSPPPHPLGMDGVRLNASNISPSRGLQFKLHLLGSVVDSTPSGGMAWAVFLLTASAILSITSVSAQDSNPTDSVGSKTVIVGAVESEVYLKKNEDGSYEGFDQDVLDELSKLTGLNFRIKGTRSVSCQDSNPGPLGSESTTLSLRQTTPPLSVQTASPDDGRYGMKVDGAWTGMMSQLINKEIDMAMGLFITMEREKYVDFSKPLLEEHLEILVKKPEYQGQPPVGLPVPEVMLQYQGQPP